MVWPQIKLNERVRERWLTDCRGETRLALTEMRLIMAKLHFKFDLEAVDKKLDWDEATKFDFLWRKPPLVTHLHERLDL